MVLGYDLAKQAENYLIDSLYSGYFSLSETAGKYFRYVTYILGSLCSFVSIINGKEIFRVFL